MRKVLCCILLDIAINDHAMLPHQDKSQNTISTTASRTKIRIEYGR